jgi:phospholipid/cholesterol/gamma-HCH transport system substrate-binding protein
MIRRSVWVKTVAFVVIAVLGVSYVLLHYVGVGQTLLGTGYTAYVDLPDSGGLFTSASVTYRGVEVGRVGTITLRPGGIRVALDLTTDRHIPAETTAVVGNGSPIGEQFIDLRPTTDRGPYLHQGSVIPQSRTSLPTSTEELLVSLDRLVRSVPRRDLHTLVTELGRTFDSTGPDIANLLDSTHQLLASAQANLPATVDLLRAGGKVLDTQNSLASSITAFSRHLDTFTGALRASDGNLRAVLRHGSPASHELSALDQSVDTSLPVLLGNLTSLGKVTSARVPALRQILIIYPYVVATSFGLFPGNGSTRFGIPTPPEEDHQPCLKGYLDPSKRRSPNDLNYPPVRYGSYCQEPTRKDVNPRGSRMAPEPNGKRLGDEPSYRHNAGLPHGVMVGSSGTNVQALGDESWRWLLFGPMG